MKKLSIKNVGPIASVDIELRRFNFFIGPQSSGKSTIAKIISTFSWLEKEACTTFSENVLPDGVTFKTFIEDFHRIHGYIDDQKSFIKYESDFVDIIYKEGTLEIKLKEKCNLYKRPKISYIPSDRNVVTMKDIEKRNLEPTNFRSFLFDWLECHKHYDNEHKTDILSLGVKYYCNQNEKDNQDIITHNNGVSYEIPLYDASSGLQSIVPLVVLVKYLTTQFLEKEEKEISFAREKKKADLVLKLIEKYFDNPSRKDLINLFLEIRENAQNGDPDSVEKVVNLYNNFERLTKSSSISFIIEEPEQNLFPQTQVEVLKTIIKQANLNEMNRVVITTHSPYIINYLNILLKRKDNAEDRIASNQLGVYLVYNGKIQNLMMHDQDNKNWIVDTSTLSAEMESMYEEFNNL